MKERYLRGKEIASAAKRREGMRATRKAAITGGTGPRVLVLPFRAGPADPAFGRTLALEASPITDAETSLAALAALLAEAGGAVRKQSVPPVPGTERR